MLTDSFLFQIMNHRRESVKSELCRSMAGDEYISILTTTQSRPSWHCLKTDDAYPFSHVLRIRVLKIVCGILEMIMGSVAVIEQNGSISNLGLGLPAGIFTILATGKYGQCCRFRTERIHIQSGPWSSCWYLHHIGNRTDPYPIWALVFLLVSSPYWQQVSMDSVAVIEQNGSISNLGLGLPAGIFTILATAVSIHTSKGFGGYRPSSCGPGSFWRILGPTVKKAIALTVLWTSAFSLNVALVAQSVHVLRPIHFHRPSETCLILAVIQLILSSTILISLLVIVKIDLTHDPD
ncbi:hypothetical protein M8J75_001589 [Diaphorina citri]|nr:hypothetical protein M8J75_001589 [Diaphorina citri]